MTFVPALMYITDITNANPAVVTTSVAHGLTTGQIVRINLPRAYGMQEINKRLFSVTVLSPTTYSLQYSQSDPDGIGGYINLNSSLFSAFVNAGTGTPANATAVGSGPTPILSPEFYFQNNVCDSLVEDATINNSTVEIPI